MLLKIKVNKARHGLASVHRSAGRQSYFQLYVSGLRIEEAHFGTGSIILLKIKVNKARHGLASVYRSAGRQPCFQLYVSGLRSDVYPDGFRPGGGGGIFVSVVYLEVAL